MFCILLCYIYRLIEAGNGCVMNIKTPYNGRHIKMIKYVISDDINCKKLLPFKRAHVPVIDSEVVIEYIITVFIFHSLFQFLFSFLQIMFLFSFSHPFCFSTVCLYIFLHSPLQYGSMLIVPTSVC